MTYIEMLKHALKKSEEHFTAQPAFTALDVIIKQLNYLIALEEGRISDRSGLHHISIGRLAARDLDGFEDDEFREYLYKISAHAKKLASQ